VSNKKKREKKEDEKNSKFAADLEDKKEINSNRKKSKDKKK
jgi:hypothetical protein